MNRRSVAAHLITLEIHGPLSLDVPVEGLGYADAGELRTSSDLLAGFLVSGLHFDRSRCVDAHVCRLLTLHSWSVFTTLT